MYGRLLPNILILRIFLLEGVWSHGRMIEPPMRSSIWRFGFNSEPNYTDNELNCGGFVNQYEKNNGKCGLCGDPYQGPRDNEAGGKYARGIIVRHYSTGQIIEVTIELTANHQGYFEFRICPHDDVTHPLTQECLNRTLLTIVGHGTRYYIQNDIRQQFVHLLVQLPLDMTCTQCVLQWKYVAGNNKGSGAGYEDCYGCGPQEHFINCADVAIYSQSVQQQVTIPVESVLDDSLESTSIIEYLEKMKESHTNRMVDFDFLADFLSVDMDDDFWEDMQLFLDSSAEPLKAIVTNTAVSMFPANKDGITKFHHLVKLSLLFQGVAPPSNARKVTKAQIDSDSSRESRLDKNGDSSDASSDSGNNAILIKNKESSEKQRKSINYANNKFEGHDLYDSWADSKDSSEFHDDSSSSKGENNKMSSDRIRSHSESQSSDSRDISESSDESNDEAIIGTRISSVGNKSPGKKRTAKVSKVKTLSYDNNVESSDDSSSSMEDSWDEVGKDTDDQSKSSGDRSKTKTNDNEKDSDSGEIRSDSKSIDSSSDSNEYSKDSKSDSTELTNDSKDKNDDGQFNADENSNDLTDGSDDSGSQSKKEDNSIDSEDSWDMSKGHEDSNYSRKDSQVGKGESKETEHQGPDTSKNIQGESNEYENSDRKKAKNSKEKDSNENLGSKGKEKEESKESFRREEQTDAKDSREREANRNKKEDDVHNKIDDRKNSKENFVSAALSDTEVEEPKIEFKKPEIEVEKLELDVEGDDLKDAFGNLKDTIKLEDEKLVAAAVMSGSEQNTIDKGKGQASISRLLVHSIVSAGPQILSSKSSTLEEQLRSALVTVFLENHNPSLSLCKDGATKARCGCTENWSKYPLVDMYCTSLCPYGYCPAYLCQCSCPKICRGLDHLVQLTAAINQWCKTNCENGQCPSHMCICD
ncbi:hypothetical protein CHS0354_029309 [Potamilus streckersoni]|uniref:Chitin-binding type-4 domain-containing protein n=1 Tax=Potamilus streckersoni TaxID=2493646 RepID=A0AAE0WBA3_9BIVA|nr:hypothetical protein CHS0354_029309 [Potamilus streckersoni]